MLKVLRVALASLCTAGLALIAGGTAHAASAGSPPPSCAASYQTLNEAPGMFVAQVTVTNPGGPVVNGWSVTFTFPGGQQVTHSWNATVQQGGAGVAAVPASWDATIPAGGSVLFGLYGTWVRSDAPPVTLTCQAS